MAAEQKIPFVSPDNVGSKARLGAIWSAVHIFLRNGISIGVTAILARLLSPDDYGLTGMVATLTAALLVFSDMGLSWATVQRQVLTEAQVHNLFWINTGAGLVLWLVCIVVSPYMAAFYGREELENVTIVMGASFLISGLTVQPMALMRRAMQFRAITLIEVSALIAGAATAVAFAVNGAGYWAIVAQGLANQSCRTVLVFLVFRWRPKRPIRGVGTRQMIGFGGLLALNGVMIYVARNLDNVLIGKVWGATELGYYNRAYFLMLLPSVLANGVLTGLMVVSLASFQGDLKRFGQAYRRAVRLVAYFATPMAVGLALTAGPAVKLVYGSSWSGVATILTWLALAGITQPIYNTTGWLFTATGNGRSYLWLTVINTLLLGSVFFVTVGSGVVALAMGYGIVMGLIIPLPALWFAHSVSGLPVAATLRSLAPVAVLNVTMALAIVVSRAVLVDFGVTSMPTFGAQIFVGLTVYMVGTPLILRDMMKSDLLPMLERNWKKKNHEYS
jgi:O-antigen/teichoic acid export membrane protein